MRPFMHRNSLCRDRCNGSLTCHFIMFGTVGDALATLASDQMAAK